jgi:LuxR family transcriptional regulator, maltose regulon positive regulatory protein
VSGNPRLIDRAELIAALDRAAAGKVTMISAPAGSGKTSLLRAWVDRPGQAGELGYLQVRRDQHDAQQFWLAVLDVIRQSSGTGSKAKPTVATPSFNGRAMVDRVVAEIAAHRGRIVLVIDDLHELKSTGAIHQLTRLLTNLPPNAHVVLATRRDLQLGLHQLRLAGELAEIRAADLRFTEREARELLDKSGIALSESGASLLWQRTEGWAAGLRLAAISLAGHSDPERFVAQFSGSNRAVAEYLIAEMLERQPPEVQQLLLRTSLLDRVNGELADLLTGRAGSERILLDLEDANAFVMSLDPERTWFRYHHLFGDLLRLELRRTMPEKVPELHRLAAGWFTEHGQIVEALRHTQAAGDWPTAARLITDHAFSLTLDGQAETIQALLRAFPPGTDYPELALVRAGGNLLRGRLDEAAAHLAVAESYVQTAPEDRQHRLRVGVAALKLSLARRRGDLGQLVTQAEFLTSPVTGASDEDIALDNDLRAFALMNLGVAEAWSLGIPDGERHLQEGADLARKIGRPYLEVSCLAQLGFASKFRSFATVRRRCEEAIALAERYGWGADPMIPPALITLASTMIWTGEFDAGERWLSRAAGVLQTDAGPGIGLLLHLVTGMLHAGRGLLDKALEEFTAVESLQVQLTGSHALATQVTGWSLATQARLGMTGQARTALEALPAEQANSAEVRNARAVICLAEGDPARALGALAAVLDGTAPAIGDVTRIESFLVGAHAHHELGDQRGANQATERALALAEPDRLVLPFAMTGSRPLVEALPRHETAHAALLSDILDVLHGSSLASDGQPATQAAALSPSELRVLRFLPTNLSRHEIAAELSVSVNTVNSHVRNIYAKLHASDRSSAVQRARELRLLSAGRSR